jgi:hypothetical protein
MLPPMKKYVALGLCTAMWVSCSKSNPDVHPSGKTFDPCAADPKPGYDPAGLTKCCDSGPAHCVPTDQVQDKLAASLDACSDGKSVCMPDPIIRGGGQYKPPMCTSSVGNAAGVCLSRCIPLVADNPQSALLGQDGCGEGELCVPCLNPLSMMSTGACDLVELLCTSGDMGSSSDGGDGGGPTCPYTGPPLIDPTTLAPCSPECGGAHCLPAALVPAAQQSLLSPCTATGGGAGYCAPDDLIATGGNFVPKSCTSVAGSEGRCTSVCLPAVAQEAAVLPNDVCASGQKCVPCYNPTAADPTLPTGACNLACDKPSQPPTVLTCPYTGPTVVEPTQFPACDDSCYGAHCVPKSLVPASVSSLLAECNGGQGYCAPDTLVATAGFGVPKSCRSVAGAEGRCLSTCLPPIAAQASALPQDVCDMGEVCAPCFDPTQPSPQPATGACTLACDQPKEGPIVIACPYSGPDLIDPAKFASCESATCSNAHCLPDAYVPVAQQGLLAPCPGGGFCAPDAIIGALNNFVPKTCASVAGVEGRCVSTCLPSVQAQASLLPTTGCEDQPGTVCAPCYDPTSPNWMMPTGACSIGCDSPKVSPSPITCPYTGPPVINPSPFPSCASSTCQNAHCIPATLVPPAQQALLAACAGGGLCAPDTIIESANNFVPPTCTSIAGVEGRCVSTCLPSVQAQAIVLPTAGCPTGTVCAPCYDPTAPSPAPPTGACSIGCDMPGPSPAPLACQGSNIINPGAFPSCASATCSNAHCLPTQFVPAAQRSLLATCAGGYCTPDPIIATANHFMPQVCTSVAGAEGRCISTCLPSIQAVAAILPTAGCPAGTKCAPCFDPTSANPMLPTGACSLSCDKPSQPPLLLTCPWDWPATKPPVVDPTQLPGCGCSGAHCLPSTAVPPATQPQLNACSASFGAGFCTPDPLIGTGGNYKPPGCAPFANVTNSTQGRCLSGCLKSVQQNPTLETSSCSGTDKCAPCHDPFTGAPTGACSLSKCDSPPVSAFKFPRCCNFVGTGNVGTCVPLSQLSSGQQSSLPQDACTAAYKCVPDIWLPQNTPIQCTTGLGFSGSCVARCVNDPLLSGRGTCPSDDYKCVACFLAPAGTPGC